MFHFCYKTTNSVDGKFYLGKHSSESLDDDYLGSGIHLQRAIKKHGKENFKREILCFFDSSEDAYEFEEVLVCGRMVANPKCYNMKEGGEGGMKGMRLTEEHKAKIREANLGREISDLCKERSSAANKGSKRTEETRNKMRDAKLGKGGQSHHRYGKKHTEETRNLIKSKLPDFHGQNNPYWGQTHSEETKAKMRAAAAKVTKQTCPHCDKVIMPAMFKRWHGDNCKFKRP